MTTMIRLHRTIDVTSFDVEATVAVGRDRPELLAVCQLALDLRRPIAGADVSNQLLGRLPEHVGWRVLDRCVDLGILTRADHRGPAALSFLGQAALELGSIPVPEEGTWRLYMIADPLITTPLVHFVRLDPPRAEEDRQELKNAPRDARGRQKPPPADPVPDVLLQCHRDGTIARSIASGVPFQIASLPPRPQGARGPMDQLRLELTWSPGAAPTMRLRGAVQLPESRDSSRQGKRGQRSGEPIDGALPLPSPVAAVPFDELWFVLASFGGKVDIAETRGWYQHAQTRLLPAAFDGLDDPARTALRRDLPIPPAHLGPAFGDFDATVLEGVDLVPRTDLDAERWAQWFQRRLLNDYATPTTIEATAHEILAKFPYHRPRPLGPQELLDAALRSQRDPKNRDPNSRFLLAPADLGLWR